MNHSQLAAAIAVAKQAARKATRTVHQTTGRPTDPALILYRSHTPADFERMRARYGEAELARYIETMEKRLIQSRKG